MSNENPLGDRGKANEDAWARQRDREAIEKMKNQGAGDKTKGSEGNCGCGDKDKAKDKATKNAACNCADKSKCTNCPCKV
jgi:hypothetical protein